MQKQKTLSVRMSGEDYRFIKELFKEEKEEVSKAVRDLVDLGRLILAIKKYRAGNVSLGEASELAGVSISEMLDLLKKFGVKSNLEQEDYLKGLKNLRRAW